MEEYRKDPIFQPVGRPSANQATELEAYLADLKLEVQAVEDRLEDLKK